MTSHTSGKTSGRTRKEQEEGASGRSKWKEQVEGTNKKELTSNHDPGDMISGGNQDASDAWRDAKQEGDGGKIVMKP